MSLVCFELTPDIFPKALFWGASSGATMGPLQLMETFPPECFALPFSCCFSSPTLPSCISAGFSWLSVFGASENFFALSELALA